MLTERARSSSTSCRWLGDQRRRRTGRRADGAGAERRAAGGEHLQALLARAAVPRRGAARRAARSSRRGRRSFRARRPPTRSERFCRLVDRRTAARSSPSTTCRRSICTSARGLYLTFYSLGRPPRARHGAAAPEAALPRRRPAAGGHRAARLPAGDARVRRRRAAGLRRARPARAPRRARARPPLACASSESPYAHVLDAVCAHARRALGDASGSASTGSPPMAHRRSSSGSSRSRHRRSCPARRRADEHAATSCCGSSSRTSRSRRSSSGTLALPHRPVRLDQPLHPTARPPRARLGQPALSLRGAGRDRRPRHRAPASRSPRPPRSGSTSTSTTGSRGSPAAIAGARHADRLARASSTAARAASAASRVTTSTSTCSPTCCCTVLIVLGCWMTFVHNARHRPPLQLPRHGRGLVALAVLPPGPRPRCDRRAARLPAAHDHRLGDSGARSRSAASCTPGASRFSTSAVPTSSTAAATRPRADAPLARGGGRARDDPRRDPAGLRARS